MSKGIFWYLLKVFGSFVRDLLLRRGSPLGHPPGHAPGHVQQMHAYDIIWLCMIHWSMMMSCTGASVHRGLFARPNVGRRCSLLFWPLRRPAVLHELCSMGSRTRSNAQFAHTFSDSILLSQRACSYILDIFIYDVQLRLLQCYMQRSHHVKGPGCWFWIDSWAPCRENLHGTTESHLSNAKSRTIGSCPELCLLGQGLQCWLRRSASRPTIYATSKYFKMFQYVAQRLTT